MAKPIPCPNPICTHQFSQADLQTAAQLACPMCGFRMKGQGPEKPKAVAPAKPQAKAAPAVAMPVNPAPSPPLAEPVPAPPKPKKPAADASTSDGTFFNPDFDVNTGPLVRTGTTKRPVNWAKLLIVMLAIGFALCVAIGGFGLLFIIYGPPEFLGRLGDWTGSGTKGDEIPGKIRNSKDEVEIIYKLALPRREWSADKEIKARFDAHSAYKNVKDYDFWFALCVKDYGMHKPRDPEMLRYAVAKLDKHFDDGVELEAKTESGKFGDLPALRLGFRGEVKSARWNGECQMFFNNGIAYWLFLSSPDKATIEHFASELPQKLVTITSDRRGWREQPAPTERFTAVCGKFDLTAIKGAWQAAKDPKVVDEKYELLLSGKFRDEKDNKKNAIITAFVLEKQADLAEAMKAARGYLDKKTEDDNADAKILHAGDVAPGQSADMGEQMEVGNRFGRVIDLKLKLKNEDRPRRYYMLGVVNESDASYGILCECAWEARAIWRQEFFDVLKSFRMKKEG
jgi:hypothetical protein